MIEGCGMLHLKFKHITASCSTPQLISSPSPFALIQPHWPSYCVLNIHAVPMQGLSLALPSAWKSLPPGLQRTHCLPNTQILAQCPRLREVFPRHFICQNALPSTPPLATHLFLTPHPVLFFFIALIIVWDCSIGFVSLPHWTVSFMRTVTWFYRDCITGTKNSPQHIAVAKYLLNKRLNRYSIIPQGVWFRLRGFCRFEKAFACVISPG